MNDRFLTKTVHENKSQGVLYEFRSTVTSRIWQERQKRFLAVGGELNGRMCTEWEVSQCKTPDWYHRYVAADRSTVYRNIWLYMEER
jgi:hypothetical protein